MKKMIVLALTLVAASLSLRAQEVAPPLNLNASGTICLLKTNYQKEVKSGGVTNTEEYYVSTTKSFNNAFIYDMISNAVAEGQVDGVPATHLPANGYIAFNLQGNNNPPDDFSEGTFYVTNKSGLYYPLSGEDASSSYYSYIERDGFEADFSDNFGGVINGSENEDTDTSSVSATETTLFYVHDNPYAYDDADYPYEYQDNNNAIEIRTTLKESASTKNEIVKSLTISSTGGATGNVIINDQNCILTAGKVSMTP